MAVAALAIAALAISFVLFVGYLTRPQSVSSRHIQPPQAIHLLIVLGSGGHTEEMLSMIKHARLDPRIYSKRTYLVSSGDSFSTRKAVDFERKLLQSNNPNNGIHTLDGENPTSSRNQEIPAYARLPAEDLGLQAEYTIVTIPRARKCSPASTQIKHVQALKKSILQLIQI
ncbi:UDP-N-acetylglucosamine transferase subunit [Emydomyces testavorans]|uniref:UDP-N-acetylglucosamine transferase subunit ALG14 n=1 Tax=Emydomyces testavorans TaxID=2070801 RepID=A0AAF0DBH5_9EURO|nr:UDP-N-acetylglucosamine transferase subunit [Emydomyces testavorans]